MNKTLKVIRRAVEVLKRDGWIKGKLHENAYASELDQRGSHCMIGAIEQAYDELTTEGILERKGFGRGPEYYDALNILALEVNGGETAYDASSTIATFNDASATTFEQVRSMFQGALRKIKEGSF